MATTFTAVTPNLVVRDLDKSLAFYRDVLGFALKTTVPDAAPYVFAWLERGGVTVFLNDLKTVEHDNPAAAKPGASVTLFITVEGIDELFETVKGQAPVVMQPVDQFYGMREFAVTDPDGIVVIFAQPIKKA